MANRLFSGHEREVLEAIGKAVGVKELNDWYKITQKEISKHPGGTNLLWKFGKSRFLLLSTIFPLHKWDPTRFQRISKTVGMAMDKNSQRILMDRIGKDLGVKRWEDWYSIPMSQVRNRNGQIILGTYNGSLAVALTTVYPEHPWDLSSFVHINRTRTRKFGNATQQREYFDELGKRMGVKEWRDWYKISTETVNNSIWRSKYRSSLSLALMTIYPEHPWKLYDFLQVPAGYWDVESNRREFWQVLEQRINIKKPEDWYSVSIGTIQQHGGWGLMLKFAGSLKTALKYFYPDIEWDTNRFKSSVKAQNLAYKMLRSNLPLHMDVFQDYIHPDISLSSEKNVETDIFVPSLKLALEYQGVQHYERHLVFLDSSRQSKDDEKRRLFENSGITLIEIPYWWDMHETSLLEMIYDKRPDVRSIFERTS